MRRDGRVGVGDDGGDDVGGGGGGRGQRRRASEHAVEPARERDRDVRARERGAADARGAHTRAGVGGPREAGRGGEAEAQRRRGDQTRRGAGRGDHRDGWR